MESRLDSAVIGCGRMGAFTSDVLKRHAPACWFPLNHAEAIRCHPRLRLSALCDRDAGALARAALAHEVERTFSDPRRMLDEVQPRLVGIATRTIGRAGLIADAIGSGVRALHVEKPLCNGVAELRALDSAFARPDVFVTYGAIRRFLPAYRRAREMVESGCYGTLREIRVQLGSGTLFWTHPHSVDLLLYAAGDRRVAGVQARLDGVAVGASPLDIVSDPLVLSATIHFDDGVTGHISQALGSDVVLSCIDAEIAVRGDGGRLETYAARQGSLYPTTAAEDAPTGTGPHGTVGPLSQLVHCLDGSRDAAAKNAAVKRDILTGQRVLFAMLQSHLEQSRIVDPAAFDDAMFIHARVNGRHA